MRKFFSGLVLGLCLVMLQGVLLAADDPKDVKVEVVPIPKPDVSADNAKLVDTVLAECSKIVPPGALSFLQGKSVTRVSATEDGISIIVTGQKDPARLSLNAEQRGKLHTVLVKSTDPATLKFAESLKATGSTGASATPAEKDVKPDAGKSGASKQPSVPTTNTTATATSQ